MGFQRNTRKTMEYLAFSGFGAAREHASKSFFGHFSLLGALCSTSGRALATLGRSLGSSLTALGGHLAPKGSTRDPSGVATTCGRYATNAVLGPYSIMPRRPRAQCHRPCALVCSPWAINAMGHCAESRQRNAMGRSVSALGLSLTALGVATWRPKARPRTPATSR